jgi:hypothetical protein
MEILLLGQLDQRDLTLVIKLKWEMERETDKNMQENFEKR